MTRGGAQLIARRIRIIAWRSVGVFCGQDNALAIGLNELSKESFARTVGVEVRSVNEVSACLAVGLIDFLRFRLR
jgi:hypothetical protein